ncbi:outer membrane beta-barrel protein [Labilibacter marinus]|uniref:outer membrane beta-barrel protein n=1 Tax=Labilibacter marinus TaxID=1477105 RepID=UPI00094FE425|nr:outer membrane beta-barrel protein [Labilibacter marinus]
MKSLYRNALYLAACLFIVPTLSFAQDGFYYGGGISIKAPTNTLSNDDFGFNDVANMGGGINLSTVYFANPQISLGSELAYTYFPKDKDTWNQSPKGDIKVNYQMASLTAQGAFYFNGDAVRPYIGVTFGFYYLRNLVNFTPDNGIDPVNYVSNTFHAGFGPEIGTLLQISRKQYATIGIRYSIIPNIEPEYFPEDDVTINPHGKQNHWELTAKLFFGKK